MLIGNYAVINKTPGRWLSGSTNSDNRSNYNNSGSARGIFYNWGGAEVRVTTLTHLGIQFFNGKPIGYSPGYSWLIPETSGGIAMSSATDAAYGTGTISFANLAGGLLGVSALTGTGTINSANLAGLGYIISSLNGVGTLTFSSNIIGLIRIASDLAGSGNLTGALGALVNILSSITGTGTLTANTVGLYSTGSSLSGNGVISASISGVASIISALSGNGVLNATILGKLSASADLIGQGNLTGALSALVQILADLVGSGSLSADITGKVSASSNLVGTGTLVSSITAIVQLLANLSGTGAITADTIGLWNMASGLVSSGTITSNAQGLGYILSTLTGTGTLVITNSASPGIISADITACGGVVTNESIAAAVWESLAASFNTSGSMGEIMNNMAAVSSPWAVTLEGTYTAGDLLRLLTAVAAGKTTIVDLGGGNATVTFRDINDTVDRVQADMTNSERTAVTLDL